VAKLPQDQQYHRNGAISDIRQGDLERLSEMLLIDEPKETLLWLESSSLPNYAMLLAIARPLADAIEVSSITTKQPEHEKVVDDAKDLNIMVILVLLGIVGMRLPLEDSYRREGQQLLRSLLQSPKILVRWGSALALGFFRDDAAFPVLIRMLNEVVPSSHTLENSSVSPYSLLLDPLIEGVREATPALLWRWGDPSLVAPFFQQALHTTLAFEQTLPRPLAEDERKPFEPIADGFYFPKWSIQNFTAKQAPWLSYAEELLYGIGVLGDFDATLELDVSNGVYGKYMFNLWDQQRKRFKSLVTDVATMPLYRMVFLVQIALGTLGRATMQEQNYAHRFADNPALESAVKDVLAIRFNLSAEEISDYMAVYDQAALLSEHTDHDGRYARLWRMWD
jgi:hypothetical protein